MASDQSEQSVKYLVECVAKFRDERGWKQAHSPENLAKSISIEAAELLELFQWNPPQVEEIQADTPIRERVAEELADVLIYAFSLADRVDMDIAEIVQRKIEKNAIKYPRPDSV